MKARLLAWIVSLSAATALVVGAASCSSSSNADASDAGSADPERDPAGEGAANDAGNVPAKDGGAGDAAAPLPPPTCPKIKHGTVVLVGDSITAGAGQTPYYRTLLADNDDAKYPAWTGLDLPTCWGIDADTNILRVAKGGAVATVPDVNDPDDMGILLNQVKKLPASLPGPVLVVGTIGGNDGQLGLLAYLQGKATIDQSIARFTAGFGAAMTELTTADRFGQGVKVDVYVTNVYDPTGGTGTFFYVAENKKCTSQIGQAPAGLPIAGLFTQLNAAMATEGAKHAGVHVLDLFTTFKGHGVNTPAADTWFVADCIHPNAKGHHAVRELFWRALP